MALELVPTPERPVAPDPPIRDRVNRLEWNQEKMEDRMSQGAETFSNLKQSVEDLNKSVHALSIDVQAAKAPKPFPWTWMAGFMFSALMVAASVIWTFAQYPDDQDFAEAKGEAAKAHKELDKEMDSIKSTQAAVVTEQRLIKHEAASQGKAIKSIDGKIDLLLLSPRERKEAMGPDR